MDVDDEEERMMQSQQLLLSGTVWSRSDDEILEDPDSQDDKEEEEEHLLIEDSDDAVHASQGLKPSPPSPMGYRQPPAGSAATSTGPRDIAGSSSESDHLIESDGNQDDADIEDTLGPGLLELSDEEDGLILSEEDEPPHSLNVSNTSPDSSRHVLQQALNALDNTKLDISDNMTGAEKRQLIIQGLQNLALSFLLQLALSTTVAPGSQDSAPGSDTSESEDASGDSDAGVILTKQRKKRASRHSFKPIKMRFAQRKRSRSQPAKKQSIESDDGDEPAKVDDLSSPVLRSVTFPTSRHASRTIAHTLRVAEIAKDALEADRSVTLRDIYYRDVALFGTQQKVNSVAMTLANTLGVRRSDLNIVAASKGLAHGHLKFIAAANSETDCFSKEGCLIPPKEEIAGLVIPPDIRFVLVVEKDAIFRPLAHSEFSNDEILGRSILITGKGYPDMSTRELIHRLGEELPHSVPILCLVDGDPHGIEIFLNYRDGSKAMQGDEGNLTCPRIQWLGVSAEDMRESGVDREYLLPLTERDISKTYKMLNRDHLDSELQRELCHMLHSRKKAEIQILGQTLQSGNGATDGLLEYLRRKIVQ